MSGAWDAEIKLLYPADKGTDHTVSTIQAKTAFDAVADVEIGEDYNEVVDKHQIWVALRNITKSQTVLEVYREQDLVPRKNTPLRTQLRVEIPGTWVAQVGDVLELMASYRVTAGANTDFSYKRSEPFIVT